MNTAAATPKAVPIASASNDVNTVPQISGRIPNCSLLGSHVRVVRNPRPYCRTAGAASKAIRNTIKTTSRTDSHANE